MNLAKLLQMDFVTELFTLAKAKGVNTCIDTSGIMFQPKNKKNQNKSQNHLKKKNQTR